MRGPHRINFAWLLKLRWGAMAGQVVTIVVVHNFLDMALPLVPLFFLVALEVATNIAATFWVRRRASVPEVALVSLLALDITFLTALLYFTGGPSNPFNFLYLVHIALAAVVLRSGWTWTLLVFSLLASGTLFFWESHDTAISAHSHHMRLHLEGMWVAFAVAAAFIVYFVTRVRRALETERSLAARNEKLAALATLAAGAAHELATPLGTIAVVARELERRGRGADGEQEDISLIREQVDRCRRILDRMAADAGERAGEGFQTTTFEALLAEAVRDTLSSPTVRIECAPEDRAAVVNVPLGSLAQAVRGLIRNAQEASAPDAEVVVRGTVGGDGLRIEVADQGAGMAADIVARIGEPFFTTKPAGKGMGLGLFLTRTIAERLGGGIDIKSVPGRGTLVKLRVPKIPATIPTNAAATIHRMDNSAASGEA